MGPTNKKRQQEWLVCVDEWRNLRRKILKKVYQPPIACIVVDGGNIPLLIREVCIRDRGNPYETVVKLRVGEGAEIFRITAEKPISFKYGKDKGGFGTSVFLSNLEPSNQGDMS